ncbi:DUF4395 family protein [Youngiibacter multivorans]|uniref:DUF4395 domain-containing protein n=1 Tax=Youngiibacter multivorans TaxID=937251 RepID=A0ABS4G875_9CLOT|nr:DUF4395 family protein [Youngiibacter multivorans]MBP1920749.1 hypothetical protein [Youngiibacter multivorans]
MGSDKVMISKGGYAFSRYFLAVLIWMSLLLKQKELLLIVLAFLLLAVALKLRRSPLVVFYDSTIGRILQSKQVEIDEDGLRFANALGGTLCLICLGLLYFGPVALGWYITGFFAVFKTVSAFGYCPGLKLYELLWK